MIDLRDNVKNLETYLAEAELRRFSSPFANDVFEATHDLRSLCRRALDADTRVNYKLRAREELETWGRLARLLALQSIDERQRYADIFEISQRVLKEISTIESPRDGHLGVLRIIRELFGFVQTDYGFTIVKEEPIGVEFSSSRVRLELKWAKKQDTSCSFGPESNLKESFWIDDLLFLHGDARYRIVQQDLSLNTDGDIERWFGFLAAVFKQYGKDVLIDRPGIFDELRKAQIKRDQEYTLHMDRLAAGGPGKSQ